ncbi:MAG: GAF domain-containing protein [Planctomycetota bacterium]|nr:MAG: GAF domain-containing protein [Planctomycetota bacterium]REK29347.1 MAG: GAF domain-containing protein [Planctomycetota bacterium]
MNEAEQLCRRVDELETTIQQLKARNEQLQHQIVERTGALQLMYDVASAANEAVSVGEAVRFVLQRVCQYNGWCCGYALLPSEDHPDELVVADMHYDESKSRFDRFHAVACGSRLHRGQGLPGRVFETGQPAWITDIEEDMRLRALQFEQTLGVTTALAFPVLVEQRIVAVLEFFSDKQLEPDQPILDVMACIGTQLGRIIERKSLERQLAAATAREQQNIGRLLHDNVSQQLAGMGMLVETLRQDLAEQSSPLADRASSIIGLLKVSQDEIRQLSRGLMLVEIDRTGLTKALEELVSDTRRVDTVHVDFHANAGKPIVVEDAVTATNLFYIAKEALHNALKHAHAANIRIRLEVDNDELRLAVSDDGKGMDVDRTEGNGMGRRIMRHRAGVIGATLRIESNEQTGSTVTCTLKR